MNEVLLENYLAEMEKYLSDLPTYLRAQIVVELHDKIKKLHETHAHLTTDQILRDLGPTDSMANHYRLQNNISTRKVAFFQRPWFKFMSIMVLAPMLLICIIFAWMVWKFTPILKIDEDNQRIVILGGLIDVDSKGGKIKIGDDYKFTGASYPNTFEGAIEVNAETVEDLEIHFSSGKIELENSDSTKLSWNCRLEQDPGNELIEEEEDVVKLNFYKFGASDCKIYVPGKMKVSVEGENGNIFANEPEYDLYVDMVNGLAQINPNPEFLYKYDLKVDKGTVATFDSSTSDEALEIKIRIKNGNILNK